MNKNKTLLFSIMLLVSSGLNAATPGAYIGGAIGVNALQKEDGTTRLNNATLGGRGFAGFNFTPSLGLELNYASLQKTEYAPIIYPDLTVGFKLDTFSIVGKLYIPLPKDGAFNFYGFLGPSFVTNHVTVSAHNQSFSDSNSLWATTAGIGFSYDFKESLTTILELSSLGGEDPDDSHPYGTPQATLLTFGFAYIV